MSGARGRIYFVLRLIVGAVLSFAAVTKIADPNRFLISMFSYELPLPEFFLRLTAVGLPWLELFCGVLLIGGIWIPAAKTWALFMFGVFLIATGQAWARGLDMSCGCMNLGAIGLPNVSRVIESPGGAFVKNILLLGATFFIRVVARPSSVANE